MTTGMVVGLAGLAVVYVVIGVIVARRSLRWNRAQGRSPARSRAFATLAGFAWPLTTRYWELDWLATNRRMWRGDR